MYSTCDCMHILNYYVVVYCMADKIVGIDASIAIGNRACHGQTVWNNRAQIAIVNE